MRRVIGFLVVPAATLLLTMSAMAAEPADPEPPPEPEPPAAYDFCATYAEVCGDWTADTACADWWAAAEPGSVDDPTGATQACYHYHLEVASEQDDITAVEAHCAHALGQADADGLAPCAADEDPVDPPVDPPVDEDPCADVACGQPCDCSADVESCPPVEEGSAYYCDDAGACVALDNPPACSVDPVDPPADEDPCAGLACGDACTCGPGVDGCVPAPEGSAHYCDADGACVVLEAAPECSEDPVDPPVDPPTELGPINTIECWDTECAAETQACANDAYCHLWADCYNKMETDEDYNACQLMVYQAAGGVIPENPEAEDADWDDEALAALQVAEDLHKAIMECAWTNCSDPTGASCADPGKNGAANRCGQWDNSWPCNCDEACTNYGDCCEDYADTCGGGAGGGGGDGGTAGGGGGGCVPQCLGKACGDDGCGGVCGTCPVGNECSAAGVCEAAACTDACDATTAASCDGDVAQSCSMGASGCYEVVSNDCAAAGQACYQGACIPADALPADDGLSGGEGADGDGDSVQSGCGGAPAGGDLLLLALALLLFPWARKRAEA